MNDDFVWRLIADRLSIPTFKPAPAPSPFPKYPPPPKAENPDPLQVWDDVKGYHVPGEE